MISALLTCSLLLAAEPAVAPIEAEVCVYGGSGAGVVAAVEVARSGRRVVLVAPERHLGGMSVEGLGSSDIDNHNFRNSVAIGGIAREFYERVGAKYGRREWVTRFEPHVAEGVFNDLLSEARVEVHRGERLRGGRAGVVKEGRRLRELVCENGGRFQAKVFIDATIEGDLLHAAGVGTVIGREPNSQHGETKNGIRGENGYRQFAVKVDPYRVPGDAASGLIPTIQDEPLGVPGEGDHRVMGYCFRMCLTRNGENRLAFEKPAGYDRGNYEIYLRYLAAGGKLFAPRANLPNGKTDLGSWHDLSANLYGMNHEYPGGDYAARERVYREHLAFTQGLCWFLANDPEVPESTRAQWRDWGVCRDEFTDNGGWPRQFYVRDARRMVSDFVHAEHHTRRDNPERISDPVAVAYWPPDMHHVRRIVRHGAAYNEGFVFGGEDWRPFGISYRSLTPRAEECENLLTAACPSSSHVAYGAIRLEWTFMALGQATAAAAVLAVEQACAVREVEYELLRERLTRAGQVLTLPELAPPKSEAIGPSGRLYRALAPGVRITAWEAGAPRCADRFRLGEPPADLRGADLLTPPRGSSDLPGTGWRFSLSKPAELRLLVMDRGDTELAGWEPTEQRIAWSTPDGKTFHDRIYRRRAAGGAVEIPPHTGRDAAGFHGVPHACVVLAAE